MPRAREGKKLQDRKPRAVREHVSNWLSKHGLSRASVDVYRLHPNGSIRLRVVDPVFRGRSMEERDRMTATMFDDLPEDIDREVSLVLILAPTELKTDVVNQDFEHPEPTPV